MLGETEVVVAIHISRYLRAWQGHPVVEWFSPLSKASLQLKAVFRVSCTAAGLAGDSMAAGEVSGVSSGVFLHP